MRPGKVTELVEDLRKFELMVGICVVCGLLAKDLEYSEQVCGLSNHHVFCMVVRRVASTVIVLKTSLTLNS